MNWMLHNTYWNVSTTIPRITGSVLENTTLALREKNAETKSLKPAGVKVKSTRPFVRPAFDETKEKIESTMAQHVGYAVEKYFEIEL